MYELLSVYEVHGHFSMDHGLFFTDRGLLVKRRRSFDYLIIFSSSASEGSRQHPHVFSFLKSWNFTLHTLQPSQKKRASFTETSPSFLKRRPSFSANLLRHFWDVLKMKGEGRNSNFFIFVFQFQTTQNLLAFKTLPIKKNKIIDE